MNSIFVFLAAVISFGITAAIGKPAIRFLHKINFGQTILEDGPKWHRQKQGTPVMGGIVFIIGIMISAAICVPLYYSQITGNSIGFIENNLQMIRVIAGFLMALCFGLIGFFDDYIKVIKKRNMGLNARQKLILQFLVAICYFATIYLAGAKSATTIPFVGDVDFGISYWLMGVILIVGMVNAVNFTDGIDGLNSSVTFFVCVFFMVISSVLSLMGASILAAACAGGCLGFLLWNFYPAKMFMGDVGSLFLGGIVCALAFGVNMPILLLPMGIVYIVEILSVVLQVIYFKATKGKRLFKMSPIHHHFELSGFNEVRICALFSMVAVAGGVIAVLLVLFGL